MVRDHIVQYNYTLNPEGIFGAIKYMYTYYPDPNNRSHIREEFINVRSSWDRKLIFIVNMVLREETYQGIIIMIYELFSSFGRIISFVHHKMQSLKPWSETGLTLICMYKIQPSRHCDYLGGDKLLTISSIIFYLARHLWTRCFFLRGSRYLFFVKLIVC